MQVKKEQKQVFQNSRFEGHNVGENMTLKEAAVEDGDILDVLSTQLGGSL